MESSAHKNIKIKGIQDGLLISSSHAIWQNCREDILHQINEKASFFQGARIALDVSGLVIHAADMCSLRDQLSEQGIILWAIISDSPTTLSNAKTLGLDTSLEARKKISAHPNDKPGIGEEGIFIQRTLRSGVKIQSEHCITILGDVNPGSEVISEKNIIVWGMLRGSVHAGSSGKQDCMICALGMEPTFLRIGEIVNEHPGKLKKNKPYIALAKSGKIQFDPWK